MLGPEAEIDRAHLLKAAQQQTRGGQQHQGDGDLRHHQRRAQTRVASASGAAAAAFFQGAIHIGAQSGKGWSRSAKQSGHNRQQQREPHHLPVQRDFADARQALG